MEKLFNLKQKKKKMKIFAFLFLVFVSVLSQRVAIIGAGIGGASVS